MQESKRKFFIITFNGTLARVQRYILRKPYSFREWAVNVINALMKVNEFPMLRNIVTILFSIRKGSIIIDFGIESNNQDLLELAARNINRTVVIDGFVEVDADLTLTIIDLEFYTLDPIINGLTINCYDDAECQDSTIICPPIGCDIKCAASYSCSGTNIIYTGSQEDEGEVNIECTNNYACYNLNISANNADNVEIHCTTQNDDNTCYYTILYAKYANSVQLYGVSNYRGYGFYYSEIYCDNASSVSLFARGPFGFYQSTLHAENAESVEIDCISGEDDVACYLSNYYLPSPNSDNKALINCYGTGCYFMGTLYVEDTANDVLMSVNSCGQCENTEDCLGLIAFRCDSSYSTSETWHGSYETSCDNCGCNEFVEQISFENDASYHQCYGETDGVAARSTSTTFIDSTLSDILVFLAGMCLCCCCICIYYQVRQKRNRRKEEKVTKQHIDLAQNKSVSLDGGRSPSTGTQIEMQATNYGDIDRSIPVDDEKAGDGVEYTVPLKEDEDGADGMNETGKSQIQPIAEKNDDIFVNGTDDDELALATNDDERNEVDGNHTARDHFDDESVEM